MPKTFGTPCICSSYVSVHFIHKSSCTFTPSDVSDLFYKLNFFVNFLFAIVLLLRGSFITVYLFSWIMCIFIFHYKQEYHLKFVVSGVFRKANKGRYHF